jgi:DNA replication protein DnaC
MSDLFDELGRLGLRASRSQLDALLTHATKNRLSPVQVVEHLVDIERRERDARNLASREKKASVGPHKTMDRFDWDHPTKIDRLLCEEQVLNLAFLKTRSNVLFRGPAGLGKTMLEQNTATAALAAGMTVCFTNVGAALADLLRQESLPAVERRIKRYTSVDLLAFDELGYVPCDARAADLLFQIISRRHEKASTIIATNLAFKEWGPMFHGAASLVPLIDRFTQHLVTVDIEGESYRQKEKDMPPTSPRSSSSARVARKAGTPRRPKRRRST